MKSAWDILMTVNSPPLFYCLSYVVIIQLCTGSFLHHKKRPNLHSPLSFYWLSFIIFKATYFIVKCFFGNYQLPDYETFLNAPFLWQIKLFFIVYWSKLKPVGAVFSSHSSKLMDWQLQKSLVWWFALLKWVSMVVSF